MEERRKKKEELYRLLQNKLIGSEESDYDLNGREGLSSDTTLRSISGQLEFLVGPAREDETSAAEGKKRNA